MQEDMRMRSHEVEYSRKSISQLRYRFTFCRGVGTALCVPTWRVRLTKYMNSIEDLGNWGLIEETSRLEFFDLS